MAGVFMQKKGKKPSEATALALNLALSLPGW